MKQFEIIGDHIECIEDEFFIPLVVGQGIIMPNFVGITAGLVITFADDIWWPVFQEHPAAVGFIPLADLCFVNIVGDLHLFVIFHPGQFRVDLVAGLPEVIKKLLPGFQVGRRRLFVDECFFKFS